jgi:hypothetical protein
VDKIDDDSDDGDDVLHNNLKISGAALLSLFGEKLLNIS